jgi:hypothetical protein
MTITFNVWRSRHHRFCTWPECLTPRHDRHCSSDCEIDWWPSEHFLGCAINDFRGCLADLPRDSSRLGHCDCPGGICSGGDPSRATLGAPARIRCNPPSERFSATARDSSAPEFDFPRLQSAEFCQRRSPPPIPLQQLFQLPFAAPRALRDLNVLHGIAVRPSSHPVQLSEDTNERFSHSSLILSSAK